VPDQYDAIGELYERVKSLPIGQVEQATLLAALPDLAGRSALGESYGQPLPAAVDTVASNATALVTASR
jgi:hypothetical protein